MLTQENDERPCTPPPQTQGLWAVLTRFDASCFLCVVCFPLSAHPSFSDAGCSFIKIFLTSSNQLVFCTPRNPYYEIQAIFDSLLMLRYPISH